MSSIDEKVVRATFQNGQFEKGIKTSLESLAALKKGMDLSGAKKGLSDLSNVANGVKLDKLSTDVEGLTSRFEGLRAIGFGALAAIGAKAAELGVQLVRDLGANLTQAARDGFNEYELQINSVQTILGNTARHGSTIKDVNKALDELNEYADKTIYNFASMTQNIGTFTVAGIKLEDATAAVKGFSNMAALAGANSTSASGAMYQLSQAMSSGVVKLQDWMSIERAGIAGVEFQDALKTTARAHGIAVDDMIKKNGSFRLSLAEGWLTADIMTQTLAATTGDLNKEQLVSMGYSSKQADQMLDLAKRSSAAATEVKTLTQVFETYAEAVGSGWAKTWQILFGDFEEAKALFTEISNIVNGFAEASANARNEQLAIWEEQGGRTAIINSLRNAFNALMKIITPIKDAFNEVFPADWGRQLANLSKGLERFTEGLIISDGAAETIGKTAKSLFNIFKMGLTVFGGLFNVLFNAGRIVWDLASAFIGLLTPLVTFVKNLLPVSDGVQDASGHISGFFDLLVGFQNSVFGPLINGLRIAGKEFDNFLNGGKAATIVERIANAFVGLYQAASSFFSLLFSGNFKDNPLFEEDSPLAKSLNAIHTAFENLKNGFLPFIQKAGSILKDFFSGLGGMLGDGFANIDWEQVLKWVQTGILAAISVLVGKGIIDLIKMFKSAGGLIESFSKGIGDAISGLTGTLEAMQMKLKADALLKIAIAIGLMAAAMAVLGMVDPERLISASAGLATSMGILVGAMLAMSKIQGFKTALMVPIIGAAMIQMATAMAVLSTAINTLGKMDPDSLANGLLAIGLAVALLVSAATMMSTIEKNIASAAISMIVMATALTILAGAVALFGNMEMGTLIQGGIAVAVALGALVGVAVIISKFAPNMAKAALGITAMAIALNLLIVPIATLGLLPFPVLLQGLLTLGILLTGLSLIATYLSREAPKILVTAIALTVLAMGINMLIAPIALLGALPLPNLIAGIVGLAAVMAIMVVAVNALNAAAVGGAVLIAIGVAILMLSTALTMLGSLGLDQIMGAVIGLAAAFGVLGLAALVLGPLTPMLMLMSIGLLAAGVGMLAMAAATVVFSIGLMALGPALMVVGAGLISFAAMAGKIATAVPAFIAIGAGLLVFGAGAAVAGAGILILGAGMTVLGVGMALVAAVGAFAAIGLTTFIMALGKMAGEMPNMLAMAGTFTVLGAGVTVLGAGLLVLGAGALVTGGALVLLAPLGLLAAVALDRLSKAIERIAPLSADLTTTGKALGKVSKAVSQLATTGMTAAIGLLLIVTQFTAITLASFAVQVAVVEMAIKIGAAIPSMLRVMLAAALTYSMSIKTIDDSTRRMSNSLTGATKKVGLAATTLVRSLGRTLGVELKKIRASSEREAQYVGLQITAGLRRGIQNGSNSVASAARSVARTALNAAKSELDIHSPSRATEELGGFYDEGLVRGIINSLHLVEKAGKTAGNTAINSLQNTLNTGTSFAFDKLDMSPTIRPVLDLSEFEKNANKANNMLKPQATIRVDSAYASASAAREAYNSVQAQRAAMIDRPAVEERKITYIQNNNSPKALSEAEIYRQTKNQLSQTKGALK